MQIVRVLIFLVGLFFLLLGMTLLMGMPKIPVFWLNSYLLGATFLGIAIPTLWVALTQTYKALVGGGVMLAVLFGGWALFLLRLSLNLSGVRQVGEFALWAAVIALWFLFLGVRVRTKKTDRLPFSTQLLIALTMTVALIEGVYLVVPVPAHFPWIFTPEFSVLYGWVLIGGSLFFAWTLLHPVWENGYPLLYGLLTYDALLIGPYLNLLKSSTQVAVIPHYLGIALIVIGGSGLWALVELCLRFFSVRRR